MRMLSERKFIKSPRAQPFKSSKQRGFTLVELLGFLAVAAVLGAFLLRAAPTEPFSNSVASDHVVRYIRYAEMVATRSRCPVKIEYNGSELSLMQQSQCGNVSATYDTAVPVNTANIGRALQLEFPDIQSSPWQVTFDALGRSVDASQNPIDVLIQLSNRRISVNGITGNLSVTVP